MVVQIAYIARDPEASRHMENVALRIGTEFGEFFKELFLFDIYVELAKPLCRDHCLVNTHSSF